MRKPFLKLRRCIEDAGFEYQELAEQVGMGISTLSQRLCAPEDKGTWRSREIVAICKAVHIPQEKIGEYFFPDIEKGAGA